MSVQMKLLPALITLLAGAITSIITFCLHYEGKTALFILLVVLLLFYILGTIVQKIILSFERKNAKEQTSEEGKVVEKDTEKTSGETVKKSEETPTAQAPDNSGESVPNENSQENTTQESQN